MPKGSPKRLRHSNAKSGYGGDTPCSVLGCANGWGSLKTMGNRVMRKTGLAAVLCLLLASCASTGSGAFGSGETARKVKRATEYIVFTPLCLLYGICPDLGDDDEF